MLEFRPEIERLRADGALDQAQAEVILTIDRRAVFSLYWELRALAWAAVALIAAGVGVFLRNNYDLLGPAAVIAVIGAAALGCYVFAIRRKLSRAAESAVSDYVLLLGALLLSADVGFAESQFHFLGPNWPRHLLLLTVLHAACAYWLDSKMLLTLSITSLAAWLGIEQNIERIFDSTAETGARALACAVILSGWRWVHLRYGRNEGFRPVFDHFVANLALWAALIWSFDDQLEWAGLLLLAVFAGLAIRYGAARSDELFVHYGAVYGYIGLSRLVFVTIDRAVSHPETQGILFSLWFIGSIPAVIVLLLVIHRRFRRSA